MWTEKTKNGKTRFVERYRDPVTLKYKRVGITVEKDTPSNRRLALKELSEQIENLIGYNSNKNVTFKQLFDRYFEWHIDYVKMSTYKRDKMDISAFCNIVGWEAVIDNVTAPYIYKKLKASGKKNITLNTYIRLTKAMLKWGYSNGLHNNHVLIASLTQLKTDTSQKERTADKFLTKEELELILAQMRDSERWNAYYFTKFLVLSGLRVGEAIALQDSDVCDGNITINKTYSNTTGQITTPKTSCSNRTIFMQKELAELIQHYKTFRSEWRYQRGIESDFFFSDSNGGTLRYDTYRQYLHDTSLRTIGRVITPHALRHTHASLLFEQGIPLETVSRRLGHENSVITRDIYIHVTENMIENDKKLIKDIKIC